MRCWHRLVAADGGYLRIAQASFYEPGDSLAPQIVKAEILKANCLLGIGPRFVERGGGVVWGSGWVRRRTRIRFRAGAGVGKRLGVHEYRNLT